MSDPNSKYNSLPFEETGYFSNLICDYLGQKKSLKPLFQNFSDLEGFKNQIALKKLSVQGKTRAVLVKALESQYKNKGTSKETNQNIQSLLSENTFTVTTGHQLNLFTGPLYFLYKIVTVINLAKLLKENFPNNNFVPIYWMATEDHDFEEINFFNFKEQKVKWERSFGGAVGRLSTEGLENVLEAFSKNLGNSELADKLKILFRRTYLENNNLADATFYLANQLFKTYGLVVLEADKPELKTRFKEAIKDELLNQTCFNSVSKSAEALSKLNYKVQVNPRPINLFYLKENIRERIVFEQNNYKVLNTSLVFSKEKILEEVDKHPDRFSPNVLMRPLYQETILPNLSYTGGGGELAYWFEMKAYFEQSKVPFPILLLRNSVLAISPKQMQKINKLNLEISDLFLNQEALLNKAIKGISDIKIDFSAQKAQIQNLFSDLKKLADKTDKSFIGAVNAQEHKQLKAFDVLEKRLLRAQKRKYIDVTTRIKIIQNELFPNKSLQERQLNFSELYLRYGDNLIPHLIKNLDPLNLTFRILTF